LGSREHTALEKAIAEALQELALTFEQETAIGGVRPDFVVEHEDGTTTVIEAKVWPITMKTINRAAEHIARYRELTGVDRVLIVLPEAPRRNRVPGVIGVSELADALETPPLRTSRSRRRGRRDVHFKRRLKKRKQVVFAAMPFEADYDDVFLVAMAGAAKELDIACVRLDKEEFVGDIPLRIREEITNSAAVIADVSGASPNVLYEVGFAHALKKPTVHICSTPLDKMPFDIGQQNTLAYNKGQTYHLKTKLLARLKAVL
jgi:hypothetical protein